MELRKIVKSTSFLVISKTVQFLVGIVRSKIAAVTIGTTGVGLFSQVSYMVNMISHTTLMSMNDGLVKLIAERKSKKEFPEILKRLMKSYSVLILISSLVIIILSLIFAGSLTKFFFGDEKYLVYFLIGLSCLPVTIANSLSFALLKSHKATKLISRSNISSSVITVIAFVPLILLFKTTGAVISVAVNYVTLLIINNYQARKEILKSVGVGFRQIFSSRSDPRSTREILRFAIFGLTSGAALIASESICRAIVINRLGIDKMGIYSPITSWGNVFQGFILSSLGIYLFPRISEAQSNTETNGVINDFFRLITFIMMPFIILAIPFRNIIIPIFYSRDFMEASVYLPWHFIGIAFYSWFFVLSQVMAPVGLIRLHGILTIVMSGLNILIVYFLTPEIGLYGWMMKFILSPILFFVIYYILLARIIDLRISARNALLMSYLIAVPLLLLTLDNSAARYYLSVFFILVCWFFLSNNEKSAIIGKLKSLGR